MANEMALDANLPLTRKEKRARFVVGDIIKGRDLRLSDVVTIVNTDFPMQVVLKSYFETIVVPVELINGETPEHIHRLKILTFTKVILLKRE